MKGSFSIGRIAGIQIGVHYTWFFIFALITWSLSASLPQQYPGWAATTYWLVGGASALALFISVLLHELAHSLVAKSKGLPVKSIVLFILGGVSNIEKEPEAPGVEFVVSVVGPMTSLLLGIAFLLLYFPNRSDNTPTTALFFYLSTVNILLGLFNLIPGFPLDGGRVFRSLVWNATKDLNKATRLATTVGQVFGWGLILTGAFFMFRPGLLFTGLWLAFIGWFLNNAAQSSKQQAALTDRLRGVLVKQAMDANPETISPSTSVEEVVLGVLRRQHEKAVPVARDGRVIGIVSLTDIKNMAQNKWTATPVAQIMTRPPLQTVNPEDDPNKVLNLLSEKDINQLLVFDKDDLVGIISRADIIRWLQYNQEMNIKPTAKSRGI